MCIFKSFIYHITAGAYEVYGEDSHAQLAIKLAEHLREKALETAITGHEIADTLNINEHMLEDNSIKIEIDIFMKRFIFDNVPDTMRHKQDDAYNAICTYYNKHVKDIFNEAKARGLLTRERVCTGERKRYGQKHLKTLTGEMNKIKGKQDRIKKKQYKMLLENNNIVSISTLEMNKTALKKWKTLSDYIKTSDEKIEKLEDLYRRLNRSIEFIRTPIKVYKDFTLKNIPKNAYKMTIQGRV